MKTEIQIIKMIVHEEMLLKCCHDRINQAAEDEKVDYLRDEILMINNRLDILYKLFE